MASQHDAAWQQLWMESEVAGGSPLRVCSLRSREAMFRTCQSLVHDLSVTLLPPLSFGCARTLSSAWTLSPSSSNRDQECCLELDHHWYSIRYCHIIYYSVVFQLWNPVSLMFGSLAMACSQDSSDAETGDTPTRRPGSGLGHDCFLDFTWTPKERRIVAFWALFGSFGHYCTYFWGPGKYEIWVLTHFSLVAKGSKHGPPVGMYMVYSGEYKDYRLGAHAKGPWFRL